MRTAAALRLLAPLLTIMRAGSRMLKNEHESLLTCISMKVRERIQQRAILGQVSYLGLRLLLVFLRSAPTRASNCASAMVAATASPTAFA